MLRESLKRMRGMIAHFKNDVILSGVARGFAFPAVFAGAGRSRRTSLRLMIVPTGRSKRGSSTACAGVFAEDANTEKQNRRTPLRMTA